MIIITDEDSLTNLKVVVLRQDKKEEFLCSLDICESPSCQCNSVEFALYPMDESTKAVAKDKTAKFRLDLQKKSIDKKTCNPTDNDKLYADIFTADLDDGTWQLIRQKYIQFKRYVTDTADMKNRQVMFPDDFIMNDSLSVGYHEVLPFSEELSFNIEGVSYIMDDQYCLSPGCKCVNAVIAFIPMQKTKGLRSNITEGVNVDYETGKWTFVEPGRNIEPVRKEFTGPVLQKYPDFYERLKKRHRDLKKLYHNFRTASTARKEGLETTFKKVGRNEPCPCGSGKKFKKCCGG